MYEINFKELEDLLRHGREIEFKYKGEGFSILSYEYWEFNHYDLEEDKNIFNIKICPFEDFDTLIEIVSEIYLYGNTLKELFDKGECEVLWHA